MNSLSLAIFAAILAYACAGVAHVGYAPAVAKVAAAPIAYAPAVAKVAAPSVISYSAPVLISAFSPQGAYESAPLQGYFLDQFTLAAPVVVKAAAVPVVKAKAVAPVAKVVGGYAR